MYTSLQRPWRDPEGISVGVVIRVGRYHTPRVCDRA